VGGERTFQTDISSGIALRETLERIIEIVWDRIERSRARGKTVTLKLRYADFQLATRARTASQFIATRDEFAAMAREILEEQIPLPQPIRLMGLTLSALEGEEAPSPPSEAAPPSDQLALF
jgi:DNA polymerase-4